MIGVVGRGVVGDAVANAYEACGLFKVATYDIDPKKCNCTVDYIIHTSDIIIICVPTPANKDYSVNLTMLDDTIDKFYKTKAVMVVSSTVPPNTFDRYDKDLVSMPEFLVAKTARDDYINPKFVVIGGKSNLVDIVRESHKAMLDYYGAKPRWFIYNSPSIPQMIKYANNFMLASKITAANLVYDACDASNVNFDDVRQPLMMENRIGTNDYGFCIPGVDDKRGFGGMCFPKDVRGFLTMVLEKVPSASLILEMLDYNLEIRGSDD